MHLNLIVSVHIIDFKIYFDDGYIFFLDCFTDGGLIAMRTEKDGRRLMRKLDETMNLKFTSNM